MIIAHISDTHGRFPKLPKKTELVVHTGDLIPNTSRGEVEKEIPFQRRWMQERLPIFQKWLDGRPLIFLSGNHDFLPDPLQFLRDSGSEVYDITNSFCTLNNLKFYGFPYIRYICGEWNRELHGQDLANKVRQLKDMLLTKVDILCSHIGIYGILDNSKVFRKKIHGKPTIELLGSSEGSNQLADLFSYDLDPSNWPKLMLHGHHHAHHGCSSLGQMTISNAATTLHLFDYQPGKITRLM